MIEIYYFAHDYTKPIEVIFNETSISVKSAYWQDDTGTFDEESLTLIWNKLGRGKLYNDYIDYGNDNIWHKDKRKTLLLIGASTMQILGYTNKYNVGLFIEALPNVFAELSKNIDKANLKYSTRYRAINALVTNEDCKQYTLNVFNNGQSSSIYKANNNLWKWNHVKQTSEIQIISTRINAILISERWLYKKFDVVLNAQGAELEVLKGFGSLIENIENIELQVSKRQFYQGGVLFGELDSFLRKNKFQLIGSYDFIPDHGNVNYSRI